jgi:hypothetical protein
MTHPALDPQLFQQFQEPLHRPGSFDAHHRTLQSRVKFSYCIPFVGNGFQSILETKASTILGCLALRLAQAAC